MSTTTREKDKKATVAEKKVAVTEKKAPVAEKKPSVIAKKATPVTREQISERAHLLWQQHHCTHGFDQEDWIRAERELLEESLKA